MFLNESYKALIPTTLHNQVGALFGYLETFPFGKPTQCAHCGSKEFRDNRTINPLSEITNYRCNYCNRGFNQLTARLAVSWVFGQVVGTILMVLGLAYLLVSTLIMLFKRNNLQKWMDYSYWGQQNPNKWLNTAEGFAEQTNILNSILMEPLVRMRITRNDMEISPGNTVGYASPNGFWLGIRFPDTVADMPVKLNPLLIQYNLASDNTKHVLSAETYQTLFNPQQGAWIKPDKDQNWQLPEERPINKTDSVSYGTEDGYRYWQIWIDFGKVAALLELEITYPAGLLTDKKGDPDKHTIIKQGQPIVMS